MLRSFLVTILLASQVGCDSDAGKLVRLQEDSDDAKRAVASHWAEIDSLMGMAPLRVLTAERYADAARFEAFDDAMMEDSFEVFVVRTRIREDSISGIIAWVDSPASSRARDSIAALIQEAQAKADLAEADLNRLRNP